VNMCDRRGHRMVARGCGRGARVGTYVRHDKSVFGSCNGGCTGVYMVVARVCTWLLRGYVCDARVSVYHAHAFVPMRYMKGRVWVVKSLCVCVYVAHAWVGVWYMKRDVFGSKARLVVRVAPCRM